MNNLELIENNPVYKQVLADSFGGIMFNVDNQNKYDSKELLELWDTTDPIYQEIAGGIMQGAIGFLKGEQL